MVIHVAGEPVVGVQKCSRCDAVLCDVTNAASIDGKFYWWSTGAFVGVDGGCSVLRWNDAESIEDQRCGERPI